VPDTPNLTAVDGLPAAPAPVEWDSTAITAGSAPVTPAPANKDQPRDKAPRVRKPLRLRPDTDQRVQYWAAKAGISANAYMEEAVEEKIRRENGDYDLPTLVIARLAQLIDQMASLSTNVANLERVTVTGFDSLMGLTRGDNYLLDEEDGEIGEVGP
jgi:predicted DNA-binding protein